MNAEKRVRMILQRLEEDGEVDIKELAAELRVSEVTIRRDINALAKYGYIHRTHGGAMSVMDATPDFSFGNKAEINSAAKEAICQRAAMEITYADIVFLDCGSTVFHLCPFIKHIRTKVITNSLPVIYALQNTNVELNVIGGELDAQRQAVHGKMAEQHIRQYQATVAFLGVDGISEEGLFANSEKEASTTLAMAAQSKQKILLCDASKIGRRHYLHYAGLELINMVITNASKEETHFLTKAGVKVVRVKTPAKSNFP